MQKISSSVLDDYTILQKIGVGSYATVYKACKKNGSREIIAMKCIDSTTLSKSAIDNLITEINLLKMLKHENVIEMKDFFLNERKIYIIMEYCDGGDLSTFIKRNSKLPENICHKFLQQLALALQYLRSHNVCHMDLKPQNLLLSRKPMLTLKVGDFGFAQYISITERKVAMRGSPLYMAPEILLRHEYDPGVDLWSVGVIMYECLFGKTPYSSSSLNDLAVKIKTCKPIEIPKGFYVSPKCKDLLISLLKHDPEKRISFEDFFAHKFLDLEHAPNTGNYDTAVALIQQAVRADTEKNTQEAFHLYCKALRYFIPIITSELNAQKRHHLKIRVNEYINRAEQLKLMGFESTANKKLASSNKCNVAEAANTRTTRTISRHSHFSFQELQVLSRSTADLVTALEMGEFGEQYFIEGNYEVALEKFKSSLKILVVVLNKEPPGRRKNLLHHQIQKWMKQAESTKGLLVIKNITDNAKTSTDTRQQCLLQ